MRTTIDIADDLAPQIDELRRKNDATLKEVVDDLLRRGLKDVRGKSGGNKPFVTRTSSMGVPLINLDNTAEVLAFLDRADGK
jgi:hypothetical protein